MAATFPGGIITFMETNIANNPAMEITIQVVLALLVQKNKIYAMAK